MENQPLTNSRADVCVKCGSELIEGLRFCPQCGTKNIINSQYICEECGYQLQQRQAFCAKCGHKVPREEDNKSDMAVTSTNLRHRRKMKILLIIGLITSVVAASVVVVLLLYSRIEKQDILSLYNEYCAGESWAEVAPDGSYLEITVFYLDFDFDYGIDDQDYDPVDAELAIQSINRELGFNDVLWKKMQKKEGKLTKGNITKGNINVSWERTYSEINVTYEITD